MIRRATMADYEAVKAICNCPKVRANMTDTETEIDPAAWLAEPRNVILWDGENVALFLWRWIGIYEGHVLFRCRGREALDLGAAMLAELDAGMVLAVTCQREAKWFLRKLGFASRGEIETIEGMSEMFQWA